MKFLIVIALVASLAAVHVGAGLAEDEKAKVVQFVNECKDSTKVTDEELTKLKSGELPEDSKCFLNCLLEKVGIVKDGALQDSAALVKVASSVDPTKAKQAFDLCRAEKGANKCETAYKFYKCLRTNKAIMQ